ncbi:hypothetical protein [Bradyrhizobium sp. LMTR 3]|uniref:hypothetical protein n=1 Tax=Bradyrhizobium sp. LMTR 3 TaxID=189873 RepID=UPI0011479B24|nr:hypothetical protein [Bradyrhizobium sp. LMTR 3]
MTRMVVDTNYLQSKALQDYFAESLNNIAVVTPFVEMEMLKGDAPVNILESTSILAAHCKQVALTKDSNSVARLKGGGKGMKKRLTGGGRTSAFRKWSRHTRERARAGDKRANEHIMRSATNARAQLADMRQDAETFQANLDEIRKRYTDEELAAFRNGAPFTPTLIEKIRNQTMEMTQQFFEIHPDRPTWPPKDDVFYTYTFRFALCARLQALYVIARGPAKNVERLPNDFVDVSVAAYATCFDGLLSNDTMTSDIYEKARYLLDNEFLTVERPSIAAASIASNPELR